MEILNEIKKVKKIRIKFVQIPSDDHSKSIEIISIGIIPIEKKSLKYTLRTKQTKENLLQELCHCNYCDFECEVDRTAMGLNRCQGEL